MSTISVQLDSGFHSRSSRDQDALHALQYPASSSASSSSYGIASGSTLRANHGGTIEVDIAGSENERLTGKMAVHKEGEHECVLIYDEVSKTYTLHRLSTTTRLSRSNRSGAPSSASVSTTPTNQHAVSPPITAKNASHLSSAHTHRNLSPSPRPQQQQLHSRPSSAVGLGISSEGTVDRNSSGRPALGRKGLPQASTARSAPVPDVEDFDVDDRASGSDSDDVVFEMNSGLSLPSQSALSTTRNGASAASSSLVGNGQTNPGLGFMNASIVLSDDEDEDEEDEGDFDDLANDLEESLAELEPLPPPMTAPPAAVAIPAAQNRATQHITSQQAQPQVTQQQAPISSASVSKQWTKSGGVVDSDIASSSESDDDSASD